MAGKTIKRVLTTGAVAASVLALTASPAFAGTNAHGYSYHEECGAIGNCQAIEHAEGWFLHDGDNWKVCDVLADGHRATIIISYPYNSYTKAYSLSATGGTGSCATGGAGIDIPEGTRVTMKVFHQEGSTGTPVNSKTYYGTA